MKAWKYLGLVMLPLLLLLTGCIPEIPSIPNMVPTSIPAIPGVPGGSSPGTQEEPASKSALVRPVYPGERDQSIFPPAAFIKMIPDKRGQVIAQDYLSGNMIFWQEEVVGAMPSDAANKQVEEERETLRQLGAENAAKMRQANPQWWQKPYQNVYVYGDVRLRSEELAPDVRIWGGASIWGWRDDEIFYSHAVNTFELASHSLMYCGELELKGQRYEELKKTPAVNLDGDSKIVSYIFPDGSTRTTNQFFNPITPEYKQYLIDFYKTQVDADADGIFIDDCSAAAATARSFDNYTLSLFNQWLPDNVDANTLSRLGIKDTSKFDFRAFLKDHGQTADSINNLIGEHPASLEEVEKVPLLAEFRRFVLSENQKALKEIVDAVLTYANAKGRTDFVVTGNWGELSPAGAFTYPIFDFATFEFGYLRSDDPLNYRTVIPVAKLGHAIERPVVNQLVVGNWVPLAKLEHTLAGSILKLGIMESYATQSAQSYVRWSTHGIRQETQDSTTIFLDLEDRWDLEEVAKAYNFFKSHKEYFGDFVTSQAKVAILYDAATSGEEWLNSLSANEYSNAIWAGDALYKAGVPFDIANWQQISAGQYKYIILPQLTAASADQDATIKQAKANGAQIVSLGSLPAQLENLVDTKSSVEQIAGTLKNEVLLSLPDKIRNLVYTDGKGDYLVHLFNYDYDLTGFKTRQNIQIPDFLDDSYTVSYASIENPDFIELDANNIVVPDLTTYGMLLFKKN
jgi:hypothetical protein